MKRINLLDKKEKRKDKNKNIIKNDLDIDYNKELNPNGICDSIYTESLPIIMEQAKESVCKIVKTNGETGTGFLCKIPFPDSFTLLPAFITCNHIVEKKDIIGGSKIELSFNNDQNKIILTLDKSRKFFQVMKKNMILLL